MLPVQFVPKSTTLRQHSSSIPLPISKDTCIRGTHVHPLCTKREWPISTLHWFVYKNTWPTTTSVVNTTPPTATTIVYIMVYIMSQCLGYCDIKLRCHAQKNVSVSADCDEYLTNTKLRSVSFFVSMFDYAPSSFTLINQIPVSRVKMFSHLNFGSQDSVSTFQITLTKCCIRVLIFQ